MDTVQNIFVKEEKMKCPKCGYQLDKEETDKGIYALLNLIYFALPVGLLVDMIPLDIEHGYSINWDMVIFLILISIWMGYYLLYAFGKVKGKYLITKLLRMN